MSPVRSIFLPVITTVESNKFYTKTMELLVPFVSELLSLEQNQTTTNDRETFIVDAGKGYQSVA